MDDERTRAAVERPRILIVEDDHQIAEMLRDSLVEQGMDAEFAGDLRGLPGLLGIGLQQEEDFQLRDRRDVVGKEATD